MLNLGGGKTATMLQRFVPQVFKSPTEVAFLDQSKLGQTLRCQQDVVCLMFPTGLDCKAKKNARICLEEMQITSILT